ncbi:DUF4270 family protein [Olivibacter sp. XZL3]|uniref:DUF4270 family protein n=1 Tax=Olivibacter sp. XZL3 TaxID=1735116 RepID=UPI001066BC0B|nr:DUF4270 family protein [Olivibacter sp. XZL3]
MKYYTRDLLTLLISLFILSSCKNPTGIGLDNNPGDSFYGTLNDTVTLKTVTLRDDSARSVPRQANSSSNIPAININQLPFGYYNDPVFGETQANVALAVLRPESGDIRLPENAQIDSAVLVIRYGSSFVGDSVSSVYQVNVKQLDEVYAPNTVYYSTKAWNVKSEEVARKEIRHFNLKDSISVIVRGSTGQDSTVRRGPELRLRLNNAFISNLLSHTLDSATVNSEAGFLNHAKGLYLTVDKSVQQGVGGLATLSPNGQLTSSGSSTPNFMEVTYRVPDSEGGTDTLTKLFPIPLPANSSTGSPFTYMTASVEHNFSPVIQNQLANANVNQTTVYAQAMGGLRTRVSFPYIDQLKGKKIAVNRAELVVYVEDDNNASARPAPRLTLYRKDVAGNNQPIPDGDSRSVPDPRSQFPSLANSGAGAYALGGIYDDKNKRYVFTMTSFVQDVILGKVQQSDVYIAPVSETPSQMNTIPFWPDITTPSSVVLKGYNPEDAQARNEIRTKLNIYYTELD